MKTFLMSLVLAGMASQAFAQEVLYEAKIEKQDVPHVILTAIETDFPDYTVMEYYAVPVEYFAGYSFLNREISNMDDYDSFNVTLVGKGEDISATYDKNGILLSTKMHMRDVAPPAAVRSAIAREYPGWTLEKDVYNLVHFDDGKKMEHYRLVLTKGNDKIRVYCDANGNFLKKSERTN